MKRKYKNILLTGASGTLGQAVQKAGGFSSLLTPSRREMDITELKSVENYFNERQIDGIIHCAALARISVCERDPLKALDTNIVGTTNLVKTVLKKSPTVRFVHISTDGVYPGVKGEYKEKDATVPYNRYGWTKLGAECAVNLLSDFCIIRTNFFNPEHVTFDSSATDIFTSKVPAQELAQAIAVLMESDFVGTVNVGGKRESDFRRYKKFKPSLKACKRKDILREIDFKIYADSSMDTSLWKKIQKSKRSK